MRGIIIVAVVLAVAASVFGETSRSSSRILQAGLKNYSAAVVEPRPGRILALDTYSTSVRKLNISQRGLQALAAEEERSLNSKGSTFSAYSSIFGQASSALHKVRLLRGQHRNLEDYRRAAGDVKTRIHRQQLLDDDLTDYQAITLNSKSFNAIADGNRKNLIAAERELRTVGKRIEKLTRSSRQQVIDSERLQPGDTARYNRSIEVIDKIKGTVAYNSIDDILQSFDDYDDYFFKFNVGYEFTTVDNTFSSGKPRVDFFLYHRYRPYQLADKEKGGLFDLHTSFAARLAGSEEVKSDIASANGTTGGTSAPGDSGSNFKLGKNESLDYDINVFMPVCKTTTITLDGRNRLYSLIGPLFVYGGKKVDSKNSVDERYYGGLRLAISPETYTDVLYGKTESRSSRRLEVRGQMPIYRKDNGSQVLLGAIANMGVTDRQTDPGDTVTIYAVWNLDVKDLFNIFK